MEPLGRDESLEILDQAMVGHLGVISDGEPYVTPTSFVRDGDRIMFRTKLGRKLHALKEHPRVCFEVARLDDDSGDWESVVVFGNAVEALDRETGELTIHLLYEKYRRWLGSPLDRGGMQPLPGWPQVMVIEIESISGLSSHNGFSSRARPGRL